MREKQLNIRLSEEEATRLEFLEHHYGLNGANVVRMLLKREEGLARQKVERSLRIAFPKKPGVEDAKRDAFLQRHIAAVKGVFVSAINAYHVDPVVFVVDPKDPRAKKHADPGSILAQQGERDGVMISEYDVRDAHDVFAEFNRGKRAMPGDGEGFRESPGVGRIVVVANGGITVREAQLLFFPSTGASPV